MTLIPTELIAPIYDPSTFAAPPIVDEIFTRIRGDFPLCQADVPGYDKHWIVSRHADIMSVSRQNDLFHNADRSATLTPKAGEEFVQAFTGGDYNLFRSLVQLDGEEHKAHRQVLFDALSPAAVKAMVSGMQVTANSQLAKLHASDGKIDFAHEVSSAYPLKVVMDIIGVPEEDHPRMLELTQWLFSWADEDLRRPGSDPTDPEQQAQTWTIVFAGLDEYYSKLIEHRRADPRNDLASLIANADINGGPMDHGRAISYFGILSTAGHDSTAHSSATGMWLLASQPDLFEQLKADQSLIPNFVEETIRWTTPVKHFVRHATRDCELSGKEITKGDRLYLAYPSGNRDDAEFEDPFTFRLDRKRNRHVGFGYGGHVCLGQHVARAEMKALWEAVIPALKTVKLADDPKWIASEFVSGPKSVPIQYDLE